MVLKTTVDETGSHNRASLTPMVRAMFESFAGDYHLSDASDLLTFQAQVTRSIECLSSRRAIDRSRCKAAGRTRLWGPPSPGNC